MDATEQDNNRLQAEFNAFRRRSEEKTRAARLAGKDEAIEALLDIVDDCDRALAQISRTPDQEATFSGVEALRRRVIRHFSTLGYTVFAEVGEQFDPRRHEAIAVQPGSGVDGSITVVHRRGWQREDGRILRPAMVTVLKGIVPGNAPHFDGHETAPESIAYKLEHSPSRPRRRKRPSTLVNDYICPFGIPGCQGDCPGCLPADEHTEYIDHLASEEELAENKAAELEHASVERPTDESTTDENRESDDNIDAETANNFDTNNSIAASDADSSSMDNVSVDASDDVETEDVLEEEVASEETVKPDDTRFLQEEQTGLYKKRRKSAFYRNTDFGSEK